MNQINDRVLECPECAAKGKIVRLEDQRRNVTAFGSDLFRICPDKSCKAEYQVLFYD